MLRLCWKSFVVTLLLFAAGLSAARVRVPAVTDWGRTTEDWEAAMWAIAELGVTAAPEANGELSRESAGYAAYLQALYLIGEEAPPEEVVPRLSQTIDAFPDERQPIWELLNYRDGRGEDKELVEDLARLVDRHPDSIGLLQNFSAALLDEREYDRANTVLSHLMELSPNDPSTLFLLGKSLFAQRKWEELGPVVEAIAALPPPELAPDHLLLLVQYHKRDEERSLALEFARRLVELPMAYTQERYAHSVTHELAALKAWDLQRKFTAHFLAVNVKAVGRLTLERLCQARLEADVRTQNYEDMSVLLDFLLSVPELPYEVLACFSSYLGDLPLHDKELSLDTAKILQLDTRALEAQMLRRPTAPAIRRQLCLVYFLQSAYSKALAISYTIRDPDVSDLCVRARILASLKRYDEALAIFAKFENSREISRSAEFYNDYGCIAEENGETERAIRILRRGVQLFPQNDSLANSLGYILADHQMDLDEAKELIDFAIQSSSDNPAFLDTLAWLHYRKGEYSQAIEAMVRALRVMDMPAADLDQEFRDHLQAILQACDCPILAAFFEATQPAGTN